MPIQNHLKCGDVTGSLQVPRCGAIGAPTRRWSSNHFPPNQELMVSTHLHHHFAQMKGQKWLSLGTLGFPTHWRLGIRFIKNLKSTDLSHITPGWYQCISRGQKILPNTLRFHRQGGLVEFVGSLGFENLCFQVTWKVEKKTHKWWDRNVPRCGDFYV